MTDGVIRSLLDTLNGENIRYCILRGLNPELETLAEPGHDVDIIIHDEDRPAFKKSLSDLGWFKVLHPYDSYHSRYRLYGVSEFLFYTKAGLLLDVCGQLVCRSPNQGEWVPLDLEIQHRLWEDRYMDEDIGAYRAPKICEIVHLIARGVYDKPEFPAAYRAKILTLLDDVSRPELEHYMALIFFKAHKAVLNALLSDSYANAKAELIRYRAY